MCVILSNRHHNNSNSTINQSITFTYFCYSIQILLLSFICIFCLCTSLIANISENVSITIQLLSAEALCRRLTDIAYKPKFPIISYVRFNRYRVCIYEQLLKVLGTPKLKTLNTRYDIYIYC